MQHPTERDGANHGGAAVRAGKTSFVRPFVITGAVVSGALGIFSTFTLLVIFILGQADFSVLGGLDPLIFVASLAGGALAAVVGGLVGKAVGQLAAIVWGDRRSPASVRPTDMKVH